MLALKTTVDSSVDSLGILFNIIFLVWKEEKTNVDLAPYVLENV